MDPMTWFSIPGSAATVDPADLRKVWTIYLELEKKGGRKRRDVDIDISSVCGPEADVEAVSYRVFQLDLLSKVNKQFAAHVHSGIPGDRVFEIAATFPMEWCGERLHHRFPFDAVEFLRRLEADSQEE